jgi:predicted Rossmann fold flavoprotein
MKVVVIGGGAAGIMSAIISAKEGNQVVLLEKTSQLGNKLKITGKGRCNLTFDGDINDFKKNIVKNYKFMYSSFSNFSNVDVVEYINSLGVGTKVERGKRIFPISDKAEDILNVLTKELKKYNVKIIYNANVKKINTKKINEENNLESVDLEDGTNILCDKCIIATGGKSYQKTGSSGDGYIIARKMGHNIIDIKPGLVALKSNDEICKKLQGLTLKNIKFKLIEIKEESQEEIYSDFGELLFAHFGITGPVVLSSSSKLNRIDMLEEKLAKKKIYASIDLKPALDFEVLDKRICRDFEKYANKEFKNSLNDLLPQKLIKEIIELSGIDENKKVNIINKIERKKLVNCLKDLRVNISNLMPLESAIITCGGIDTKEINPKTMESKLVKGVYFAGEILDIDAYTGGYNLQIAFSTANAAGKN